MVAEHVLFVIGTWLCVCVLGCLKISVSVVCLPVLQNKQLWKSKTPQIHLIKKGHLQCRWYI